MPRASEKESFPAKIGDIELELECDFSKSVEMNRKKKLDAQRKEQVRSQVI
jgi:hypothetical protein